MSKFVTVFIPVYNGEKYLQECIEAILVQKLPRGYQLEILVTDSGSTDSSIEILRGFGKHIVFDQIPNSEFGHGKTRQRAIDLAKGDFVLFLSQDASPANNEWLIHMIEPFFLSERVGCVYGRQVPRANAIPAIKREVNSVFDQFGIADQIVIHRPGSLCDASIQNDGVSFFSDVNSAVRKDINKRVPYRNLKYAEDQALAQDMFTNNFWIGYAPQGVVWHSNEYSIRDFRKRKFDEYIGLQESINYNLTASKRSLLLGWLRPTIADWKYLLEGNGYGPRTKLRYLFSAIGYNVSSKLGQYEAAKYIKHDDKRAKLSLEQSRKKS